jgi:hypothetical protein
LSLSLMARITCFPLPLSRDTTSLFVTQPEP